MTKYIKANIKNNIPMCECGCELGRLYDYFAVEVENKQMTGFVRYCSNQYCRNKSVYLLDASMDLNKRYIYPSTNVKIIREK